MARFESLRITSPGATLAARHYPGRGEPIVMLHGGPGMGDYFDTLPEMLSPPYRIVTYDQRGCGASSCDGTFDVSAQVADLDSIRKHLGANRMHVFGHSWGGLLAQLYAKAHPEHAASLVLCCSMANTGRSVAGMESKGINERVISKPKRSQVAYITGGLLLQLPGRLGDLGFGLIMRQLLPNYVVRAETAPKAYDVWRASKRAWRGTNSSIKALGDDYLAGMTLDAPVLILQGELDVIRETNPVLADRFPRATNVWIENAAHFPWLEQPDKFAGAVLSFYRKAVRLDRA
jgi:proline iminopeptidase